MRTIFPNLTLIEQVLAEQPHIQLITAMQGQLGIELARRHSPDLICWICICPTCPAGKCSRACSATSATRDIPVVIISADATSRQIKRLMAAGARAYLTKPLDMQEFFRVIDETSALRLTEDSVAA